MKFKKEFNVDQLCEWFCHKLFFGNQYLNSLKAHHIDGNAFLELDSETIKEVILFFFF